MKEKRVYRTRPRSYPLWWGILEWMIIMFVVLILIGSWPK